MSKFLNEYWFVLKHCVKQPQWWVCVAFFLAPVVTMFFGEGESAWNLWFRLAWLVIMPLFITLYVWVEWKGKKQP